VQRGRTPGGRELVSARRIRGDVAGTAEPWRAALLSCGAAARQVKKRLLLLYIGVLPGGALDASSPGVLDSIAVCGLAQSQRALVI